MKRYKIAELKGFESVVAYNAFTSLLLGISLAPTAIELIRKEVLDGITAEMEIHEKVQLMCSRLRELPDDNEMKRVIWLELLKITDKESTEYLHLFKICTDANGITVTTSNVKNFNQEELQNMLYDAFCTCLSHGSEVFF